MLKKKTRFRNKAVSSGSNTGNSDSSGLPSSSSSTKLFFKQSARRKKRGVKYDNRFCYGILGCWLFSIGLYIFVFGYIDYQPNTPPTSPVDNEEDLIVQTAKKIDRQKQKLIRQQQSTSEAKEKSKLVQQSDNNEKKKSPPLSSTVSTVSKNGYLPPVESNVQKLQHPHAHAHAHPLPQWITNYIQWHNEMRAKFPGKKILTDPNAPKLLIRICLGLCGGLHDRLGQLPLDLYMANQTKRVLLIKWQKPQPLQEFLIPPSAEEGGIDWTFPTFVEGWGTLGDNCNTLNECARQVRAQPKIDGNVQNKDDFNGDEEFASLIDNNIRVLNEGKLKDTKHVTFTILGHLSENVLEERLKMLGEVDMIHNTPTFGNIFHSFFKPHPNVQKQIDSVSKELGLVKDEYTVVHCRVRHPKAYPMGEKFRDVFVANADKTGLPFEGRFHELAVGIASRAIKCAAETLQYDVENHPIYFMSDSSDLVSYMAFNLTDSEYTSKNPRWFQTEGSANVTAKELVSKYNVVGRDQSIVNAHIDKNKGRPSEAYYATFVDLFLGINAKCVSFGIGYYAAFAAKISGTKCKVRYARELWGELNKEVSTITAPTCSLPL